MAVRKETIAMHQSLHSRSLLESLRTRLLRSASATFDTFDKQLEDIDDEKCRHDTCNRLQRKAAGELRLAAKVQEFIWQWEKDRHGYDSVKGRQQSV